MGHPGLGAKSMDTPATFSQDRWDEIWTSLSRSQAAEMSGMDLEDLWEQERWAELIPLTVRDLIRAVRSGNLEAESEELVCVAVVLSELELFDESSILWRRVFHLQREQGDPTEVDAELHLLAWPLARSAKPAEAIPVYQACIEANRVLLNDDRIFLGLANLGSLFQSLNRSQEALDCFEEALPLASETAWDVWGRARILEGLSGAHQRLGDLAEAIWFQQETIDYLDQQDEKVAAAESRVRLGELHALSGRPADGRAVIMNATMALESLGEEKKAAWASMKMWDMD
jgi:tetratricopeptide (TPR) repeat protein